VWSVREELGLINEWVGHWHAFNGLPLPQTRTSSRFVLTRRFTQHSHPHFSAEAIRSPGAMQRVEQANEGINA